MCTCNGSRFVADQLETIAAQTRPPCELIVCDDDSTDATIQIVESFAKRAPFPVRLARNGRRLGSTKNFEKAICLCRGDLIALCDQDDLWGTTKLQSMAQILENEPELGGIFSDASLVDERTQPLRGSLWRQSRFHTGLQAAINDRQSAPLQLMEKNYVTGAALMFRSRFVPHLVPIAPEWVHDAWIALLLAAEAGLRALPEPLMSYRLHDEQQIGIRPSSWCPALPPERQKALAFHDVLTHRWRSMTARLVTLALDPVLIELAQRKLEFLETRSLLRRQNPLRRLLHATAALPGYFRFSRGLLSYCRDVTRS